MSSPPSASPIGNNKPPATTPKRAQKMSSNRSLDVSDLLNFTLPPRQVQVQHVVPRRSKKVATTYGVWNKEKFVNAQYRFVMNPTGDYTVHFADPDIFFQWEDILQVIIPRTSALAAASGRKFDDEGHITCPICLSPPSAPRMTKCGHVFCFPCILHYLDTSKQAKWHRCPICFDSVNEKQLKPVTWLDDAHPEVPAATTDTIASEEGSTPRPGSTLHMRLIHRPQITTLALPRSHTWPSDALPPHQAPFHFLPDVYHFARFMLATPAYLLESLSRDLDELEGERRLFATSDLMTHGFLDKAEEKVRLQMVEAAVLETDELKEAISRAEQDVKDIELRTTAHERKIAEREKKDVEAAEQPEPAVDAVPEDFLATQQYGLSAVQVPTPVPTPKPAPSRDRRQRRNINPPPPSNSTYYYYQAASGAPIFLHPLDIRILLAHFHNYASFPDSITVRVDAVAEGSVNDDLRKRCKYLGHVPESADVVFVEADLLDVVGVEGLKNFEGLLKTRSSRRKEKERKDERARVRAEEKEREKTIRPTTTTNAVRSPTPDFRSPTPEPPLISPSIVTSQPSRAPSTATITAASATGAWGQRSFASALHSSPSSLSVGSTARVSVRGGGAQARTFSIRDADQDEWEMDAAWHELERGVVPGGRKKRGNKIVLSGGAGGRRR